MCVFYILYYLNRIVRVIRSMKIVGFSFPSYDPFSRFELWKILAKADNDGELCFQDDATPYLQKRNWFQLSRFSLVELCTGWTGAIFSPSLFFFVFEKRGFTFCIAKFLGSSLYLFIFLNISFTNFIISLNVTFMNKYVLLIWFYLWRTIFYFLLHPPLPKVLIM